MKSFRLFSFFIGILVFAGCQENPSPGTMESQEGSTGDTLREKLIGVWRTNEQWQNHLIYATGTITFAANGNFKQVVIVPVTRGPNKGAKEDRAYSGTWYVEDEFLITRITKHQSKSKGEQALSFAAVWRAKIIRVSHQELVCDALIPQSEPGPAETWERKTWKRSE